MARNKLFVSTTLDLDSKAHERFPTLFAVDLDPFAIFSSPDVELTSHLF